jgi:LiaI-LiaF-like transmembrane region
MSRYERRRRRHRSGAGGVVGAIWLIGLGVIFLLTETIGWSWEEAWPLFVILLGLGSLVSRLVWDAWRPAGPWGLTWPLAILAVGIVLLLSTTGTIGTGPGELVGRWWPVALIVLGAWFLVGAFWPRGAGSSSEHLALPLAGASSASVRLRFGAGTLAVGRAASGSLVDGVFEGGVAHRVRGQGDVELEPDPAWRWAWFDRPLDWRVGLTGEAPLDLRVESGAARAELDLSDLQLRSLRLETGASETQVRLPRAAGETRVRAEAGAAQVTFEVPANVAARIRSRVALGSTQVDSVRFPRSGDGYESADFAGAANRVEIELSGGVGSFRVVSA